MSSSELYQYAEALRLGEGVEPDLDTSLDLHRQLAESGRPLSYTRMAAILFEQGRLLEAKTALENGSAAGNGLATMRLAISHLRSEFGDASDPQFGLRELEAFVETSDSRYAAYTLARAYEDGRVTQPQPQAALAIYERLAAGNHGASLTKLGDFAREGEFGPPDPDAAIGYYKRAAEAGHSFALLQLARLSLELGQYQDAIDAYQEAIAREYNRAEPEYARAHFLGEFGPLSDRGLGQELIKAGAESGDVRMASMALELWERRSRRIQSLDLEGVLGTLDSQMRDGSTDATRALARAYRVLSWRIPNARTKHREIVESFGDQLGRSYFREFFHTTYDPARHRQSREAAYEVARNLSGEDFYYAARSIRSTEGTAFVYLLQRELQELGYYRGNASAVMNTATLDATLRFCADQGIMDTCTHGPLRYSASMDIINALVQARR